MNFKGKIKTCNLCHVGFSSNCSRGTRRVNLQLPLPHLPFLVLSDRLLNSDHRTRLLLIDANDLQGEIWGKLQIPAWLHRHSRKGPSRERLSILAPVHRNGSRFGWAVLATCKKLELLPERCSSVSTLKTWTPML